LKLFRPARALLLLFLLGPAVLLFTMFVVLPIFQAAVFSLYKWNGLGPMVDFRGFHNFELLFKNTIFGHAVWHNFIIVFVSLAVELPLALLAALILAKSQFRLAVLFRTLFFLPYVLSEVITGVLWQFLYHPQFGLIHLTYTVVAPGVQAPALLGSPSTVLGAIIVVIVWKYFGFHMSILIAGLQDIPTEIQEAAKIDGANERQTLWKVVLPLLKPTIFISVFFSIVGSFQIFDVIWAMGKGDPVNAAESMVTYLYKFGIQRMNLGYGGAVAVTIFLLCLVFSVIYFRAVLRAERRAG